MNCWKEEKVKMYDQNNIFAKIIKREISCERVFEDEKVLFFYDVNPQAKIHVLGIPKNQVVNFRDFISNTDEDTVKYFFDKILEVINKLGLDKSGYRLITNDGMDANQEVKHFHVHILGGENLRGIK